MNPFVSRLSRFAWAVTAYNILVVLWGAYVRATGSGAGCGSHWPLCNGEVIPQSQAAETAIEFTHRVTSGLAFLAVLGLLVWVTRTYPKGAQIRLFAWAAMALMISESLVGAVLVLFEWVAGNITAGRVFVQGVHLANTMLLLFFLTLTAWSASGGGTLEWSREKRTRRYLLAGLLGVLLMSMAGAVTALGDSLFPATTLAEGIRQDFSATAHFLVRLRVWHPVMAAAVGLYLYYMTGFIRQRFHGKFVRRIARWTVILFGAQLAAGAINLFLLAPVWMQIVHLFLADLVWILLCLLFPVVISKNFGTELIGGFPS
jgi:heme A synthase